MKIYAEKEIRSTRKGDIQKKKRHKRRHTRRVDRYNDIYRQ